MKAAVYEKYGPPEVVSIKEVEKPSPKADEVLLKVHACTVNRTDAGFRSAIYFVSRFFSGLFRPKQQILGCDFAGVIEELGTNVHDLKLGDRIFGFNDQHFGGHAEYMTVSKYDAIAHIPSSASFAQAAALSEGGHYALSNIKAAKVKAGQDAMVYGATGAIGSAAVQLLKHWGANVTAVANTKNIELTKGLGADEVIDYQTQDFTKTEKRFDFIFDAVGKSSFGACKPLLKPKGIYISTELGKNGENIWRSITTSFSGGKRLMFPLPQTNKEDMVLLSELFEKGEFKPVLDRSYKLEQIVEAYHYVESGQKTGNVVLQIVSE